jgi:hypothetical protein
MRLVLRGGRIMALMGRVGMPGDPGGEVAVGIVITVLLYEWCLCSPSLQIYLGRPRPNTFLCSETQIEQRRIGFMCRRKEEKKKQRQTKAIRIKKASRGLSGE